MDAAEWTTHACVSATLRNLFTHNIYIYYEESILYSFDRNSIHFKIFLRNANMPLR